MSVWDSGQGTGTADAGAGADSVEVTSAEVQVGDGQEQGQGQGQGQDEASTDETADAEETEEGAAGEEAVDDGEGEGSEAPDLNDDAAKAIKAGTFKPDPAAMDAMKARMKKGFPGVPDNVIHKLAANELYIDHLKQLTASTAPVDKVGADGLTEYERSVIAANKEAESKKAAPETSSTADIYERLLGKNYENPEDELKADTELINQYNEGKVSYRQYKAAQTQKLRSTLYRDPETRAIISQVMAEELESAGILPSALREISHQAIGAQDWKFALEQLSGVKGYESLVELSKVTSPEQLRLPDGTFVNDSELNRLRLANWDDIKDIKVDGKNARQTAVNTNLARLRALARIHKNKIAANNLATSAAQTGVQAGKKAAVAQAKAGLNGGGKTAAPPNKGFNGAGEEPYSAQFKNRPTRFSDL